MTEQAGITERRPSHERKVGAQVAEIRMGLEGLRLRPDLATPQRARQAGLGGLDTIAPGVGSGQAIELIGILKRTRAGLHKEKESV